MTGVVANGVYYNTDSGLSAPNGFLDRLTQAMDNRDQFRNTLRGLAPALQGQGIPVASPPAGIFSQMLGAVGLGSQQQPMPTANSGSGGGLGASPPGAGGGAIPQGMPSPGGSASTGPSSGGMMGMFGNAIAGIESKGNGDYSAVGADTGNGNRALGRYQVMASNVGPWTKEILGQELTPQQFLANPQAQDAVFGGKFGQYLQKTGSPADAASMWFTGRPQAQGANAQDQLGTTCAGYGRKFMAALPGGGAGGGGAPGGMPAQASAYTPTSSGDMPRAPALAALNGAAPMPIATASRGTQQNAQPPIPEALGGPGGGSGSGGSAGGPSAPGQVIQALVSNPATRAQGQQLWQQYAQRGAGGAGAQGGMNLPAGISPEALATMISTPETMQMGLGIFERMLTPPITKLAAGESLYAGTRLAATAPSGPQKLSPGEALVPGSGGAPIASVPALPVKLGPGEALVPQQGGAPLASLPPTLHFSDVNGHVVGSNPQSGASADVTPAGVPTSADLKATEGTNSNILDKVSASRDQAVSASRTIDAINRQQTALDQGTFTGGGADTKLKIRSFVSGMLGVPDPGVEHTQEFIAAANSKAAELAKQLSNSGHTTNADINMAKIMSGADPNYSMGALREIGRAQQQLALDTINRHNTSLDQASQLIPALAQRQSFYKVPMPTNTYDFATAGALARARAAIAQHVPRDQVIQRLQAGGVDPGRL